MNARRFAWVALVGLIVVGSVSTRADSLPVVRGNIAALELCPESACGVAIFVGAFAGQVGVSLRTIGDMAVAVTHDDLPNPGETAAITGGVWQIQTLAHTLRGVVTGGTLFNNGNNTFHVNVNMAVTSGGLGTLSFSGTLSHNTFPPTLVGAISQ